MQQLKTSSELILPEDIIWKPLPGSQTLALSCPADIILYDGTRGPGKTDAQLMRFRRHVGQGFGKYWRGIIFDREYKNLDDLVSKSQRWFPEFKDGVRFLSSKSDYRWVWPTGEQLLFRTAKRASDYWSYHGQEFPFIGWNELTKYPTDELFEAMMSCNRSSYLAKEHPMIIDGDIYKETGQIVFVDEKCPSRMEIIGPEIPLEVFATTNPFGAGHNWVKTRFIDPAPAGSIVRKVVNVFNPQTQQREDVVTTQARIFGSYRENKYLSPKYVAELDGIRDPNKRKAWLGGSWDVVSGSMFDDVWSSQHNVVEPFRIPSGWKIDRSFDWGSAKPFSVGWWAESDGTPYIDHNGKEVYTVRGDLFRIAEWYGAEKGATNTGLRLVSEQISRGIITREINMGLLGRCVPGPADNAINDVNEGISIADRMKKVVIIDGKRYNGVSWTLSDKSQGSRIIGWDAFRELLLYAQPPEGGGLRENPGMFIFRNCTNFVRLVPYLPRDETNPDDVDTEAEDHIGDEARYRCLAHTVTRTIRKAKGL